MKGASQHVHFQEGDIPAFRINARNIGTQLPWELDQN